MKCKYCNTEVEEELVFCPQCGNSLVQQIEPEQKPDTAENTGEAQAKPKKKVWKLILAIAGAVTGLCVLAVVLLIALGVKFQLPTNDIHRKQVYSVAAEKAEKKNANVVAVVNGKELTNAQLQIYYRMQILDFMNYYGSYLSYMGLDYEKPLSQQECTEEEGMTWEQFFLQQALETWYRYQVLVNLAEENGFVLDAEIQADIESIATSLEEQAPKEGYENADDMVKELLGPSCTVESYITYVKASAIASEYYASVYETMTPNADEIAAYFAENEASFTQSGITKDSGLVSSVRHILVCPEGGETDETGTTITYSDEAWNTCLTEAEAILNEWKSGEATQESFSLLASKYTEDTGSSATGGLYENVGPNSNFVETFRAWATDANRQPGDTGIVKSQYGYHIMYFVSGEPYWSSTAENYLLSERMNQFIEDAKSDFPMTVNYGKIVLPEMAKTEA